MKLSNLFRKQKESNNAILAPMPIITPSESEKNEVKSSENEETEKPLVISYATGWPIDIIYGHLRKNYEEQGYNDALVKSDLAFKDMNKDVIHSRILMTFRQVNLKYNVLLNDINIRKRTCKDAGLFTTLSELEHTESIILAHKQELAELEKDFTSNENEASIPLKSYECGFLRGIATVTMAGGAMTINMTQRPLETISRMEIPA